MFQYKHSLYYLDLIVLIKKAIGPWFHNHKNSYFHLSLVKGKKVSIRKKDKVYIYLELVNPKSKQDRMKI